MLSWALAFFIIAGVTGLLGFVVLPGCSDVPIPYVQLGEIVAPACNFATNPFSEACKVLCVVFIVLFLCALVAGCLERP